MVNYQSKSLDLSLYALSDPTRRQILARIVKGETTVGELAEPFNMSLAAVSKHLQVLERARFVEKEKSGRTITCKANLAPLNEVLELLEDLGRYWNLQLDSLERFLAADLDQKGSKHGKVKRENSNASSSSGRKGKKR